MAGIHAMMMVAGGSSGIDGGLYLMPNGVTISAQPTAAKGKWHLLDGKDYYVAKDYDDLVSVVSVYKNLSGSGEVFANLTRDGQTKAIPLNQVVTTFVERFDTGSISTGLFSHASGFNQLIGSWDVSNVTNMYGLFSTCPTFNQDLSGWDVSNVTDMAYVFQHCIAFNQDLSGWDVSNVTYMTEMFNGCIAFNQDLSGWDVSNVTYMTEMFNGCIAFNQDLSGWCVSKIPTKPEGFDTGTPAAWTTVMKPKWGVPC